MSENPRAEGTQWTGVDPRAEMACSHLLDSIKTRGHTNNAQIIDDYARSRSGNVFRTLGRGRYERHVK